MAETTTAGILSSALYAAMILAIVVFVHKVFWFAELRKIQARLVGRALEKLRETTETTVIRFDRGAGTSWVETQGPSGGPSPTEFVRATEARLHALSSRIAESRRAVAPLLERSLRGEAVPEDDDGVVLELPRLGAPALPVVFDAGPRPLRASPAPDPRLFELEVRSRYGLFRRALTFVLGLADVVYSSAHVARMSQNDAMPASVLLRRMSLVVLILAAIIIDIGLGARAALVAWSRKALGRLHLDGALDGRLPDLFGLGLWLLAYGVFYLALYFVLRRQSAQHMRALRALRDDAQARCEEHTEEERRSLATWATEYGHTLDDATLLVVRQAEFLVRRTIDRLRRRLASPTLLAHARAVSEVLFDQVPESSTRLGDVATNHEHSFAHALWPRPEEMQYQVKIAQYRAAYQDLEAARAALRGPHPAPERAAQLWRSLAACAKMFRDILPEGLGAQLHADYPASIESVVSETEADLDALDARLTELAEGLRRTFDAAETLIDGRLRFAEANLEAHHAALVGEILSARERARLEAMAFEI